nr:MAG TPA: hypothetical protein [Caudoviricetes sp.]
MISKNQHFDTQLTLLVMIPCTFIFWQYNYYAI